MTDDASSHVVFDMTLKNFNVHAAMWANSFDPQYRTLLWIISKSVNRKTGWTPRPISYAEILRRWTADPHVNKAAAAAAPSTRTIRRNVKKLIEVGILNVDRGTGQFIKYGALTVFVPTAFSAYSFQPDFTKTVQFGLVVDSDWPTQI